VRRPLRLLLPAVSALALAGALATPAGADHNADDHSPQAQALANIPRSSDFQFGIPPAASFQSDLAFQADLAIAGNYNGFRVIDVSDPASPQVVRDVWCPGPQNDVSIWDDLIILSVDTVLTSSSCSGERAEPQTLETGWEGLRIFRLSDVLAATPDADGFTRLEPAGAVYTKCGSHTHTGIPDGDRVIVYVASYSLRSGPDCGPHDDPSDTHNPVHLQISVVDVPLGDPAAAQVIGEPAVDMPLWTDLVGIPGFNPLGGCHDIQVYPKIGLAAAACASVGQLWDISDPANPKTSDPLWVVDEPDVDFYHSGAFTWDGKVVIFGDEALEGNCSGPQGQIWFHEGATGDTLGSFQIPRVQGENDYCSAHLFNVLKTGSSYRLVASWYTGGVTVIDFTRPSRAREVAYYDFAPVEPQDTEGLWAGYSYNGFVYTNGLFRGFDTLFIPQARAGGKHLRTLNPQTQ
jgi:hypothetical protein